jgi:hypothetical protein
MCALVLEGSQKLPPNEPPSAHASKQVTVSTFHGAGSDTILDLCEEAHERDEQLCELMYIICDHHLKYKAVSTTLLPQCDPFTSESTNVLRNCAMHYKRLEADLLSLSMLSMTQCCPSHL